MVGASDCQFVGGDTSRWDYSGALDNVQASLDVAGMLPVAGEVFDGANAAIYAARGDVANAALSAAAMIPGAGNGATVAKLAGKYGDEAAAIARTMCSFSADTPVATPDGEEPIGELEVGDQVLAFDEQANITDAYTVTAVLVHRDPLIVTLTVGGERIETTPEHPFFVVGSSWRAASDLNVGDELRGVGGAVGRVEAIEVEATPEVMFNLTVAVAHTFFVGDTGWLVHNTCNPYEVGEYAALKAKSQAGDGLEIHHVPQQHPASQVISGYDYDTGSAIALPRREHRAIPTIRGTYTGTSQDLIARDLANLDRYTNTPASSRQQLINLIDRKYPGAR